MYTKNQYLERKSMPKNVLVVGMPRSGTSMTASIFASNGYFVAEDRKKELRAGDEYNPTGYWEADELIQCNSEIFSAAGFNYDNTWLYDEISDNQAATILTLEQSSKHEKLVEKFNQHSPWIWKDPRLCYTLGYWWPLLNIETTRVLFLKRDPKEIYSSFIRLKWRTASNKDKEDVLFRIKKHLEATETALKKYKIPYIVVNYSEYRKHPEKIAHEISQFFELTITKEDLGYQHKYNNHSVHGSVVRITNKIGDLLPNNIRKIIKKIIPSFIWKLINPHRYSK